LERRTLRIPPLFHPAQDDRSARAKTKTEQRDAIPLERSRLPQTVKALPQRF
jgi:hypothetical protein